MGVVKKMKIFYHNFWIFKVSDLGGIEVVDYDFVIADTHFARIEEQIALLSFDFMENWNCKFLHDRLQRQEVCKA